MNINIDRYLGGWRNLTVRPLRRIDKDYPNLYVDFRDGAVKITPIRNETPE